MDLVQIRYFLALARTLNFTRAAEHCNVTQPALTKSIQRLEDELGGKLLLRERALTQLTELGRTMLPLLEETYLAAERARDLAAGLRRQSVFPLRLGFGPDIPLDPFLALVAEVGRVLPGLELTLAERDEQALVGGLLHDTLDAALLSHADGLVDRLHRWTLFSDHTVAVFPPGDALAEAPSVDRDALAGRPLIGTGIYPGLPPPRHRVATSAQALPLVRLGLGIAVMAARAQRDPELGARMVEPPLQHDVVLALVAGRTRSRAADAFAKLARARGWEAGQ